MYLSFPRITAIIESYRDTQFLNVQPMYCISIEINDQTLVCTLRNITQISNNIKCMDQHKY